MPSLISSAQNAVITGVLGDVFDTRSKAIIIYKEPIKTPITYDSPNLVYGFGESQQQDAYTYIQVTGIYPAVIVANNIRRANNIKDNSEIMVRISDGDYGIKVRKDCRDYINNGKTEKITFDDKTCLLNGEEVKINDQYYLFELIVTK